VSPDGSRIVLGTGDVYDSSDMSWVTSIGGPLADLQWVDDIVVAVDIDGWVTFRDPATFEVLNAYHFPGSPVHLVFDAGEGYLVHLGIENTDFARLPLYDGDADTMPRWWEEAYGLNDEDGADGAGDLDGDGLSNAEEYEHHGNPEVADTDGDQLTDLQEVVDHGTDPSLVDTDADGLTDHAEVTTHASNPLLADSDDDEFGDRDEVLFGGDPNDDGSAPQPLDTFAEDFEPGADLAAWSDVSRSQAPWFLDTVMAHGGTTSFRSGAIDNGHRSSVVKRVYFTAGTLNFWARVDAGSCCDRTYVFVDGVMQNYLPTNADWQQFSIPLAAGFHDIEWRYERDTLVGVSSNYAVWIDDLSFTAQ
jgi:hypothetical protein